MKVLPSFLKTHKNTILYGAAMAFLLIVLKYLELKLVFIDHAFEVYVGSIAIIFTALGIWLAQKLTSPKTEKVFIDRHIHIASDEFVFDQAACSRLNISKRELEVLRLVARGCSNGEIAAELFVSMNTVKTHITNLFSKLDVRRRTQAVEKAKQLRLIP
ncbi:MAG TPA: LuxR C-terminal-related transcriptional regulator [Flavobacterium sp.]|jgi:DNA-binding CsgD family transcriptional regulator